MNKDSALFRKLREAGASSDITEQYWCYVEKGNKQGQERLLCRCRMLQKEKLIKDREKLACLDYMIAKVEKNYEK